MTVFSVFTESVQYVNLKVPSVLLRSRISLPDRCTMGNKDRKGDKSFHREAEQMFDVHLSVFVNLSKSFINNTNIHFPSMTLTSLVTS